MPYMLKGNPVHHWGAGTVASAPTAAMGAAAGDIYYATNGRKSGEGAAAGTGILCFFDGTNWKTVDVTATLAA